MATLPPNAFGWDLRPRRPLRRRAEDTPIGRLAVWALVLAACSASPDRSEELTEREWARQTAALEAVLEGAERPPAGAVRIRLAFGAGADLDLYVTDADPRSNETVYFARHATRSGGRLLRDARCSDAAPRTDSAVFEVLPRAGLRIGVDHHASCGAQPSSEPFVVEIAHGELRELRRGVARPGHFDDRFWLWLPSPGAGGD